MSNITLTVHFEAVVDPECSGVQNFAAHLATNLVEIKKFVPELVSLIVVSSPPQAPEYRFSGELIIDQASTLGQYIWIGKPEPEQDTWLCEEGSGVFWAIAIITNRIFCVPFQPIDLEPEQMFGISCAYRLCLIQIVVEEGENAYTYPFGNFIRGSGGGAGLSS